MPVRCVPFLRVPVHSACVVDPPSTRQICPAWATSECHAEQSRLVELAYRQAVETVLLPCYDGAPTTQRRPRIDVQTHWAAKEDAIGESTAHGDKGCCFCGGYGCYRMHVGGAGCTCVPPALRHDRRDADEHDDDDGVAMSREGCAAGQVRRSHRRSCRVHDLCCTAIAAAAAAAKKYVPGDACGGTRATRGSQEMPCRARWRAGEGVASRLLREFVPALASRTTGCPDSDAAAAPSFSSRCRALAGDLCGWEGYGGRGAMDQNGCHGQAPVGTMPCQSASRDDAGERGAECLVFEVTVCAGSFVVLFGEEEALMQRAGCRLRPPAKSHSHGHEESGQAFLYDDRARCRRVFTRETRALLLQPRIFARHRRGAHGTARYYLVDDTHSVYQTVRRYTRVMALLVFIDEAYLDRAGASTRQRRRCPECESAASFAELYEVAVTLRMRRWHQSPQHDKPHARANFLCECGTHKSDSHNTHDPFGHTGREDDGAVCGQSVRAERGGCGVRRGTEDAKAARQDEDDGARGTDTRKRHRDRRVEDDCYQGDHGTGAENRPVYDMASSLVAGATRAPHTLRFRYALQQLHDAQCGAHISAPHTAANHHHHHHNPTHRSSIRPKHTTRFTWDRFSQSRSRRVRLSADELLTTLPESSSESWERMCARRPRRTPVFAFGTAAMQVAETQASLDMPRLRQLLDGPQCYYAHRIPSRFGAPESWLPHASLEGHKGADNRSEGTSAGMSHGNMGNRDGCAMSRTSSDAMHALPEHGQRVPAGSLPLVITDGSSRISSSSSSGEDQRCCCCCLLHGSLASQARASSSMGNCPLAHRPGAVCLQWDRKFILRILPPVSASDGATTTTTRLPMDMARSSSGSVHNQVHDECRGHVGFSYLAPGSRWWVFDQHAVHERVRLEFFLSFAEALVLHAELPIPAILQHPFPTSNRDDDDDGHSTDKSTNSNGNVGELLLQRAGEARTMLRTLVRPGTNSAYTAACNWRQTAIPDELVERVTRVEGTLMMWGWRFWHRGDSAGFDFRARDAFTSSCPLNGAAAAAATRASSCREDYDRCGVSWCIAVVCWPVWMIEGVSVRLEQMSDLVHMLEECESIGSGAAQIPLPECGVEQGGGRWLLLQHATLVPSAMLRFLVTRSCRGAVMFGDVLNSATQAKLIDGMRAVTQFYLCSHGRPAVARQAGSRTAAGATT